MRALALLLLLLALGEACAHGLDVGNTTTFTTLRNKNAYHPYGTGKYEPPKESLTVEQCKRSCLEDPKCDCATQETPAKGAAEDSKQYCWRHNQCNPGGFVSDYNDGYDVYMQVVATWHLQGVKISNYSKFGPAAPAADPGTELHIKEGGGNATVMAAVSEKTVSAFTIRSRTGAKMSLVPSAAIESADVLSLELFANGTVLVPGHGLRKLNLEAGATLRIEPGRPWRAVADLGHEQLQLPGALEVAALHAKVVLPGLGHTAELLDLQLLQLRVGSPTANATVLSYVTLWNKNAYKGFGGTPLFIPDDPHRRVLSAEACQEWCSQETACDCATWKRTSKQCYLRKDCHPELATSNYNNHYNLFMKVRTPWFQEAMTFADNRFVKAAEPSSQSQRAPPESPTEDVSGRGLGEGEQATASGSQLGVAASQTPVESLTLGVGWCGVVGLSTTLALDADFGKGYFVNVSSGLVSIPLHGAGPLQVDYKDGTDIQFSTKNGEVFVSFPGSGNEVQYLLGRSPGATYGKFVLWEAGSSVSVRNLTSYVLPPRPQTPQDIGGGWHLAVFVSLGVLLLIALAAMLVAVRFRRKRKAAEAASNPALDPALDLQVVIPNPTLLGSANRRSGTSNASASVDKRLVNPAYAAISLEQLVDLMERAKRVMGKDFKTATMHDVSSKVLQPLCDRHGLCYAHCVNSTKPLKVDVFVTHAWQENFEEFVISVRGAFEHWTVKPNLWICATALLQGPAAAKAGSSLQVGRFEDPSTAPFVQALSCSSKLLVVRNRTVDLFDRIWCCWEIYCAYKQGLVQKPGSLMVVGPQQFNSPSEVDMAEASSSDLEDKRRILLHALQTGILPEVNKVLTELAFRRKEMEQP